MPANDKGKKRKTGQKAANPATKKAAHVPTVPTALAAVPRSPVARNEQLTNKTVSGSSAVLRDAGAPGAFSIKTGVPTNGAGPLPSNDGVLQMVVVTDNRTPSVSTGDSTSAEMYETLRKKGRMGNDNMLHQDLVRYVRCDLFPKLKFFMDNRQLHFSTAEDSLCYQIYSELGFGAVEAAVWWEKYKNKIVKQLNSKRADVTSAMKRLFMSK